MTTHFLASRESVKIALDAPSTARADAHLDRTLAAVTGLIENTILHRSFAPTTATRFFDWPNETQRSRSWRLWLDHNEVISVATLTAGGTVIPASDYFLEPVNDGPPYTAIEINLGSTGTSSFSTSSFAGSDTHQRAVQVDGVFGHSATETPAGALAAAVATTTATSITVDTPGLVGVGHVLRVGTERMIVTERTWSDTTQNVGGPLVDQNSDVTIAVTDGTAFLAGETILIDSERMLITDVAGNTLTVKRAWDGSVLAAHSTGADVFHSDTLTVTRGALGTTAVTHLLADPIVRHVVPELVESLAIAEAITIGQNDQAGWARTIGQGDGQREAAGRNLKALRQDVRNAYGRTNRHRAI
jgi:hypothetical protein